MSDFGKSNLFPRGIRCPLINGFLTGVSVVATPSITYLRGVDTMNKFDPTQLRTKFDNTNEGWIIQVYGGDRRLLCVLESSHAWTFFLGCCVGLLVTVGWFNLARYSPTSTYEPPSTPPEMSVD